MRYMLEWEERRGRQRMACPDIEDAKAQTKEMMKNGVTSRSAVYDLDSPYPYTRVAGWKRPKEPPHEQ